MEGSLWIRSVLLPLSTLEIFDISPFEDVVLIFRSSSNESVSMIVQAVPQIDDMCANYQDSNLKSEVRMHPFTEEFLTYAVAKVKRGREDDNVHDGADPTNRVEVCLSNQENYGSEGFTSVSIMSIDYQIQKLGSVCIVRNLANEEDFCLQISLRLVFSSSEQCESALRRFAESDDDDEGLAHLRNHVKRGFECRSVKQGVYIPLNLPCLNYFSKGKNPDDFAIFYVEHLKCSPEEGKGFKMDENGDKEEICYSLGSSDCVTVEVVVDSPYISPEIDSAGTAMTSPGYEKLVSDIIDIANVNIRGASPCGIILSGCAGVGKTRMATTILNKLMHSVSLSTKLLSMKDVVLQASSSMDSSKLKQLIAKHVLICRETARPILIFDDLDLILANDSDDGTSVDAEKRIALNAVVEVIDDLNEAWLKEGVVRYPMHSPFILGICCDDSSSISSDLARVGRFEKIVSMSPPTEDQRGEILRDMFQHLPIAPNDIEEKEAVCKRWSIAVAPRTAGCVAADLKRMCADVLTRSKARAALKTRKKVDVEVTWSDVREAARVCTPSQLSQLDVSLVRDFGEDEGLVKDFSPRTSFFRVWNDRFGGYKEMKERVLRTIVGPWKRHHATSTVPELMAMSNDVPPPSGVLFHGASGTGKTFAAECLALSLALNVVRVRASDILDQWLGGSEAAIRAIFARARAAAPCVLFFDELDAVATNREDDGEGSSVHSRLLSTLLNEMDGVNSDNTNNDVLVVGTTNRINAIDAALLRPGRFEVHILLGLPTIHDVKILLEKFLEKVPMSNDVNLDNIAELLVELEASAADVKGVCSDACLAAIDYVDASTDIEEVILKASDMDEAIRSWKR